MYLSFWTKFPKIGHCVRSVGTIQRGFRKILYKNLLFCSLLLRQQTASAGAVPKQLNNKNVIVCTFCAKNMATNGIFGKYIIKKMEKQARKVSFWVNEPFETRKGKDHEKEVRIISMFIRCIHNTDFCTFMKTRCKEDKKVSVTFSNSILLQRDSKFWWNICWV